MSMTGDLIDQKDKRIAILEDELDAATYDYTEYQRLYREQTQRSRELEDQLHDRTINSGKRIRELEARVEWREDGHDGIYCRDETIRLQGKHIKELEANELHEHLSNLGLINYDDTKEEVAAVLNPVCAGEFGMLESRIKELVAQLAEAEETIDEGIIKNEQLYQDRYDALSVTSSDGLLSSEWILRTGKAERRVKELEVEIKELEADSLCFDYMKLKKRISELEARFKQCSKNYRHLAEVYKTAETIIETVREFFPVCGEVQCTAQYTNIQALIGERND